MKNKFSPSTKRVRFVSFPVVFEILGLCLSLETPSAVNLQDTFAIFVRPFRHPLSRRRHTGTPPFNPTPV
jgi:hypothetical protein